MSAESIQDVVCDAWSDKRLRGVVEEGMRRCECGDEDVRQQTHMSVWRKAHSAMRNGKIPKREILLMCAIRVIRAMLNRAKAEGTRASHIDVYTLADGLTSRADRGNSETCTIADDYWRMARKRLTPRQLRIVQYRFGLDDHEEMTQERIAHAMGLSQQTVSHELMCAMRVMGAPSGVSYAA